MPHSSIQTLRLTSSVNGRYAFTHSLNIVEPKMRELKLLAWKMCCFGTLRRQAAAFVAEGRFPVPFVLTEGVLASRAAVFVSGRGDNKKPAAVSRAGFQ
jgi:hypothetical protein